MSGNTLDHTAVPLDETDERLRRPSDASEAIREAITRIRRGQSGSLPIVVGLVLIAIIFQAYNPVFLSSTNLVNVVIELAPIGTVALGVVLVLLVGQIDLSVGSMVGVASAILGVTVALRGWPIPVAIALVMAVGALVGLLYATVMIRFGVPSFVITLAGLLALLGAQLRILGTNGSINISFDSWIVRFAQQMFLPAMISYLVAAVIAGGYAIAAFRSGRRRAEQGLSKMSTRQIVVRACLILAAFEALFWYLNRARGVSVMAMVFVVLVVGMNHLLTRTRWGRSVYAVGGSVEAARRAGINVNAVYVSVFTLCSTFAALGGLMAAGRLATASISSGSGSTNLNAIAAAVIGGTSLFGGRGSAYSALLGIVVIETISNGLTLLSLDSSMRFMITGAVLMVAVIVDSVSRRSRLAHGGV